MELIKQKVMAAQDECATHLKRMAYAYRNISQFLPVDAQQLAQLNDEQIEALDQYIYRFTKLQDAMGLRLFNHTLSLLAENTREMPFIDKLNRLEQLGALESAAQWLELRQLRNLLAHEYASDDQEKAAAINLVFNHYPTMVEIMARFEAYLQKMARK